jgi:phosphoglycerol transferase MdoB-like AlkP superfamily enzyme
MNTSQIDRYSLKHYTRLMISFFGCLFVLSIFQYTALYFKGVLDNIFSVSFLIAVVHQIGFVSIAGIILVFPFNFWENLRPKYGFRLIFVVLILLLIIEAMLIGYYFTTLVPLGSDLLGYSFSDIKTTISNSGSWAMSLYLLGGVLTIIALFFGFYRVTSNFYHKINRMYPFTIILLSLFVTTLFTDGKPINQNKTQYLAINLYNSSTVDHSYTADVEYPLIKRPENKNVIGKYFEFKEEKPNIVFIMVEGLGRDFVGEGAEYEGFTPFLDSLSRKSLYWENCLSNTGRTFGVIPSLFGSLPFGTSGFMELEDYPNKLTLFSILKNNGYHTSFYQGTTGSFDNVEKFLRSEDIDFMLDKSGFGKNYELAEENSGGFTWGYPDKELFKKSMSIVREKEQPRLEVYMTISTHEPFTPPNQDYYEEKVEKILSQRSYDSKKQKVIEKNDNVFASLLYTDDALKWAMEAFKKQPKYDNTIFVITGDHRLIPIPMRNELSRFHVPLIIYSPMLNDARKLSGITSHFDVTPSILSMLDGNYELKMPKKVAWLGSTLDVNEGFKPNRDIPLMRNKNQLEDFISGDKFYSNGKIYEVDENMDLSTAFSGGSKLEGKLENFAAMNSYVTLNNKIIPDSLAIFTLQKERFTDSEIVWINSVYNGKNSDKAYLTARDLAFKKEYDRSLLLCRYILSEVPGNIDARILTGRINGWRGNYDKSIEILEKCINENPEYIDSYSALFDVFYWSGKYKEALDLIKIVEQNSSNVRAIDDKISRARMLAGKHGVVASN